MLEIVQFILPKYFNLWRCSFSFCAHSPVTKHSSDTAQQLHWMLKLRRGEHPGQAWRSVLAWNRACLAGVNEAVERDGEGIAMGQAKHGIEKAGCRHTDGAQALG